MPESYTHGHGEPVLRAHRWRTAANSAAYLIPHLRPGLDLLDVGCGPGTITLELAELVGPGRTTAIDTSAEVIAQARELLAGTGTGSDLAVDFRVGDIYSFRRDDDQADDDQADDDQADDGRVDVVHAHQVLQHVTDPVTALAEMRRLCRPGGLVAARDADYAAMTWHPQIPELERWLALYRRLARRNGGEPDAGRRLRSWAMAAGFTTVTASASVWCFAETPDRQWWADTWAERVTGAGIGAQALAEGEATQAELDRIAEGWRRWAACPDAWFAVLHGEVLCRP